MKYPEESYLSFQFAYLVGDAAEWFVPFAGFAEQSSGNYVTVLTFPYPGRVVSVTVGNGAGAGIGSTTVTIYGDSGAEPTTSKASSSINVASLDTPVTWDVGSAGAFSAHENLAISLNPTNNANEVYGTVLVALEIPR